MSTIQGYLPTITNKNKRVFCAFGGGKTKNYLDAECVANRDTAYDIAQSCGKSIYDLPGAVAIDGNCKIIIDQKRRERNARRREQNQVLRDLCGTSARAAREDMGLSRS